MSRNAVRAPTLGADFRDARRRAGLSQTQLAGMAGISQPGLSEIEAGRGGMFLAAKAATALSYDLRLVPSRTALPTATEPADGTGEREAREFIESITVFRPVDAEIVDAILDELQESPLPGARYAHEVVKRRFAAALSAPAGTLDEAWKAAEAATEADPA